MLTSVKPILLFIFILLFNSEAYAQYTPFFENYALTEFNAGNQNWGISSAENGKIYFANDKGLVEYDGLIWDFYQLPNKTIIRSVLAYEDLIYTGSYEEFGYWKENTKGKLIYTPLNYFKKGEEPVDEEFWQIFSHDNNILFRSFSNLYIYKDGEISQVKPKSSIISCDIIDDKIYVSTLKHGIYVLKGNKLEPFLYTNKLINVKIVSITKFNNKFLITTDLYGCFLYDEEKDELIPWQSEIDKTIKEQQLNSFSVIENGIMVFGTIKNGVYITNHFGDILFHISRENGLLNNTVLSQKISKNNKLWIGLDNGVALIDLNYNHVLYNDNTGKLGAVYDVIKYKDLLYIGSNTGLFYLNNIDNKLKFVEGSQGQVWDLKEINGQLFCGHNDGTFLVEDKKLKKISDYTGGWVIKKIPELEHTYIQGTYTGLIKYEYVNNSWHINRLGDNLIPIKFLVFEDAHTAWVAHAYKGLYRVKFDENYNNIIEQYDYSDKGLWSDFNVKVHKIKNEICFKTNKGWQKYEALIDRIVPHDLLNNSFGTDTEVISESDTDLLVTKSIKDRISLVPIIGEEFNLKIPNKLIQKRLVVEAESVSQLNDSIYTLNLYDGFMLINKLTDQKGDTLQKPLIERIEIEKQLVELIDSNTYEFSFNKKISITLSSALSRNHHFEYAISNSDTLNWYKMDNGKLELSSLSNGDYQMFFRTANELGEVSSEEVIQIKILPPWYKNSLFFVSVAFLLSLIFYWLHKRKVEKEQRVLHEKLVKEQEALLKESVIENDKKIVQLKNQSLKNEIKLKSKQLANTAIALVKKNESMLEIKNELLKNKSGFENPLMYKRLLRKIDNSIGHEDEWELFEYNFNQVHEEFFNQLKSKHPKLTHKDLKICAYIKMNLLSKEIAPLMNVSIRGLETHRYRLKRKLNLENNKPLGDYLRNFQ